MTNYTFDKLSDLTVKNETSTNQYKPLKIIIMKLSNSWKMGFSNPINLWLRI